MLNIPRLMQISILVVVLISGSLLALSTNNAGLFFVASICAVCGFIFTDLLKWFRIEGWLANVVSIAILIFAMKDFFEIENSGKLIAVANLLVYLQSFLMFQSTTPRLNWQILVLSLLQIVITTIFSVDFSYSYLLLAYFVAAGIAMVLQSIYTDSDDITKRNKLAIARMNASNSAVLGSTSQSDRRNLRPQPLTLFDASGYRTKTLFRAMGQLFYWTMAGTLFTAVLFLMAPKSGRSMFQPISHKVSATGFNNEVNLNETGVIRNSKNVILHAKFEDPTSGQPIRLRKTPYIRSMALATLSIEDDQTNWRAPFDRVDNSFYGPLTRPHEVDGRFIRQVITLEQTSNPMIYGVMPIVPTSNTAGSIEFCREVSAHVRCRADAKIALSPYKYEFGTLVDARNSPLPGWPHLETRRGISFDPIARDSLTHQWLTEIDPGRYPVLIKEADRMAAKNDATEGSLKDLVDAYTNYFSANRFKYTLDYRNVPRDTSIDSLEDFFANHRSGHCEMYASALTLMLRSQNIPARLVVGFIGGDFNDLTESYVIRADHAHAWVEVYFHPDQCNDDTFPSGIGKISGAWITADPNPAEVLAGNEDSISDPIELARSVWQDVVLGIESDDSREMNAGPPPIYGRIQKAIASGEAALTSVRDLPKNRFAQIATVIFLLFLLLVRFILRSISQKNARYGGTKKVGIIRRLMASAVGLISSDLEQWMLSGNNGAPLFYDRLIEILQSCDLARRPNQTQREFAEASLLYFKNHQDRSFIERVIKTTTNRFYQVRFGDQKLTQLEHETIGNDLDLLKKMVAKKPLAV